MITSNQGLPKRPLSLAACWEHLDKALGPGAPALITLRRHARAGQLDGCIAELAAVAHEGGANRVTYDVAKIVAHYRQRVAHEPPSDSAPPSSAQTPGPQTQHPPIEAETLAHIRAEFAALRRESSEAKAALATLVERVNDLTIQVRGLNAVRASLMTKYDAATLAAQERADRLEAENKTLRRAEDPNARALLKIQMDLARVLERMNSD